MNPSPYHIDIGEIRLPVIVRKHKTSRRMIVRYQPKPAVVSLTLPRYVSIKQGLQFVNEKRDWIAARMAESSAPKSFTSGQVIPVFGRDITLAYAGGRGVVEEGEETWLVHGAAEFMERRVRDHIKKRCAGEIKTRAEIYAAILGVRVKNITLRDTSSRWGSCSSDGSLSFSWRLAFAPYEVLDYVVAHEVAHIREHNHGPKFWKLVTEIFPNWEKQKNWLSEHGKSLHNYG